VKAELEASLATLAARHSGGLARLLDNRRQAIRSMARGLPSIDMLLALPRRRFDEAASGLGRALQINTADKRREFERRAGRLTPDALLNRFLRHRQRVAELVTAYERRIERHHALLANRVSNSGARLSLQPAIARMVRAGDSLRSLSERADKAVRLLAERRGRRLAEATRLMDSMSYRNVLQRGYAVVRNSADAVVGSAASLASGEPISVEFGDGRVNAVTSGSPGAARPRARPASKSKPKGQGDLF